MDEIKQRRVSLLRFKNAIPNILLYQIVSKAVLSGIMLIFKELTNVLFRNMGRSAFTSGDLPYLLHSWQGWCLLLCGFLIFMVYAVFDIYAMIQISETLLYSKPVKIVPLLKYSFVRARHLFNFWGVLILLYAAIVNPLTLTAFGITLTVDFGIPEFILSVIHANFLYNIAYKCLIVFLGILGIVYIFTFHFMVLADLPAGAAMKESRKVMQKNWKPLIKEYLLFMLKGALMLLGAVVLLFALPVGIMKISPLSRSMFRIGYIFCSILASGVLLMANLLYQYFSTMKLTLLYEKYAEGEILADEQYGKKISKGFIFLLIVGAIIAFVTSIFLSQNFNEFFPKASKVGIVAHRAGGTLANENTCVGIEAAIEHGAKYAEVDVQRTKDGGYIINHDDNFQRCCGDSRTPGEMTIEEIKELRVINHSNPLEPSVEVATIEEMLDCVKGRVHLFLELKGVSADYQMADDMMELIREKDMMSEVTLISLSYKLLDYIERRDSDFQTGYLCFFSFGNIERMNCDKLMLEEETATPENVDRIHKAGKKVYVWTVNASNEMLKFMGSKVDGIITDEIDRAVRIREQLCNQSDESRITREFITSSIVF